jgi:hypothetical protein
MHHKPTWTEQMKFLLQLLGMLAGLAIQGLTLYRMLHR